MADPQVALAFEDGITRFVSVEEDQTIIDAAYKARINLPFDCRDGACGTCKAFCESGEYEEGDYIDEAMTEDEADDGYILQCQTYPLSDMVVQVPITSAAAKTSASTLIGTITELDRLSESTVKFAVQIQQRDELDYLPGQYMNIAPPNADFHRSYSFSSGPSADIVTFLVKYTPGGKMTSYLTEEAKVGDELNLTGPMGSFFLREPENPILLLAGGTGLAPILAILERLAETEDFDQPVRLIYGATFTHDIVEVEKLDSFKDRLKDFDWFTVVSSEDEEHERKGYVTQHIDTTEHLHDGDADVYLCGPPPMVEAVRVYLNELETPPLNFFYEKFTPQGTSSGGKDEEPVTTVTRESEGDSRGISVSTAQVESGEVRRAKSEAEAVWEALSALEFGISSLLVNQLDKEDLDEMERLAKAANQHIQDDKLADAQAYIDDNLAFHEFLFKRSGNDSMLQAYRQLRTAEVMVSQLEDGFDMEHGIDDDHLAFVDALRNKDLAAVKDVVERHTTKAVGTMKIAIDRKAQQ